MRNRLIPTIIRESANADLSNEYYMQVYAGANASPTINGTTVTMAAGSTLDIIVQSISSTANVYVLGVKKNVIEGGGNILT